MHILEDFLRLARARDFERVLSFIIVTTDLLHFSFPKIIAFTCNKILHRNLVIILTFTFKGKHFNYVLKQNMNCQLIKKMLDEIGTLNNYIVLKQSMNLAGNNDDEQKFGQILFSRWIWKALIFSRD